MAAATLLAGPLLAFAPPARAQVSDVLAVPGASPEWDALMALLDRLFGDLVPAPAATVAAPVPPTVPPPTTTTTTTTLPAPVGMLRPVPGPMMRGFGYDGDHFHKGVDLDGETGDPILAARAGVIADTSCGSGYGICTIVDHGNGLSTLYAHLSRQIVTSGPVKRGQVIGLMGCTGSCTGSHLHFEVHVDGVARDPLKFL